MEANKEAIEKLKQEADHIDMILDNTLDNKHFNKELRERLRNIRETLVDVIALFSSSPSDKPVCRLGKCDGSGKMEVDNRHHAPMCPANHYHLQRKPTGNCNCGAVDVEPRIYPCPCQQQAQIAEQAKQIEKLQENRDYYKKQFEELRDELDPPL